MEQRVKDRLADLVKAAPTQLTVPTDLAARSHRRTAMMLATTVLVTLVVVLGAVTGVRALIRTEGSSTPADHGTGVDGSVVPGSITVVMSGHEALDIDPDTGSTSSIELPTFGHVLAWSPDGSRLLFSDFRRLEVLEPDGSVSMVEQTGPDDASEGSWSPDGTKIVYMTDAGEKNYPLRIVSADGSGLVAELGSETVNGRYPAWSPDGSTIAYLGGTFDRPELWLIGADGTDPHMIVGCDPGVLCPVWSPPTWSPDGARVAFAGADANGAQISVVAVDGTGLASLTEVVGGALDPSWSPDGTRIAFVSTVDGRNILGVMDADGQNIRSLDVEVDPSFGVLWHRQPSA